MTLSFMTHWSDGTPTNFINKIWNSLLTTGVVAPDSMKEGAMLYIKHSEGFKAKFGGYWIEKEPWSMSNPKHHTIRFLTKERAAQWRKEGREIHFSIGRRQGPKYQFAPVVPVKSLQKLDIKFLSIGKEPLDIRPMLWVDGYLKYDPAMGLDEGFHSMKTLAENDGFDSIEKFFDYFSDERVTAKAAQGKHPYLIHWTDLTY